MYSKQNPLLHHYIMLNTLYYIINHIVYIWKYFPSLWLTCFVIDVFYQKDFCLPNSLGFFLSFFAIAFYINIF